MHLYVKGFVKSKNRFFVKKIFCILRKISFISVKYNEDKKERRVVYIAELYSLRKTFFY